LYHKRVTRYSADHLIDIVSIGRTGKDILNQMIDGDRRLAFEIVEANGLRQLSDPDELSKICMTIIKRFPQQVREHHCV